FQVESGHHVLRGEEPAHRLTQGMPYHMLVAHMPTPAPHEGSRARPSEYDPRPLQEEMMNALVVEDSPQIAERLVELVSVPDRVEVVATAATEDEALSARDQHTSALAI